MKQTVSLFILSLIFTLQVEAQVEWNGQALQNTEDLVKISFYRTQWPKVIKLPLMSVFLMLQSYNKKLSGLANNLKDARHLKLRRYIGCVVLAV